MNGLMFPMYEAGAATTVGFPSSEYKSTRYPGIALRNALRQREWDSIATDPRLTDEERKELYRQYRNRRAREVYDALMAPFTPAFDAMERGLKSVALQLPEPESIRRQREEALHRQQNAGMSDIDYNTLRYYQLLNERANGR